MSAWNPQKQGLRKWQCSLHDAIIILPGPEFPLVNALEVASGTRKMSVLPLPHWGASDLHERSMDAFGMAFCPSPAKICSEALSVLLRSWLGMRG